MEVKKLGYLECLDPPERYRLLALRAPINEDGPGTDFSNVLWPLYFMLSNKSEKKNYDNY
jgi:hypothetical protein